ncbi:alpha/beta fold hydrolase [Pseudoprimorskyibacter insulae]|uniref:2-hydroxymuconate semialdehyde hydrolase n=1 Tax=Pseudoprimorskyibacter insulae TaxID=1695997 RepID=A0A2R8AQK6_9RHOB|nr:alpha/beta hydrolase [Pseudoprimorskyibacter insulae]SPF78114.1 2-hydroxymuconate semialdehyde hydrolase [Pseudoprimorskyibacter insulae]
MMSRRALLAGLGGLMLAGGAYVTGAYRTALAAANAQISRRSSLIETEAGPIEYAVAGDGPPVMMIHGTGGGFDQGLLFASALRDSGFQIVAPSRFGYLRSAFPDDASPAHQADVLVALLDHLGIQRLLVMGGSAGALTAAEFALRHPDRCSHLVLLVPAANLTGRDPVEFTAVQQMAVNMVLNSNLAFWSLSKLAKGQMIRTLLATDPSLLSRVAPEERQRAELILDGLMPISRKADGLRTDGFWAGTPSPTAYEDITVPTLILSCDDDLFGTADTARRLADRIPDATLTIWPEGGHIWLGHDADIAREITAFFKPRAGQ